MTDVFRFAAKPIVPLTIDPTVELENGRISPQEHDVVYQAAVCFACHKKREEVESFIEEVVSVSGMPVEHVRVFQLIIEKIDIENRSVFTNEWTPSSDEIRWFWIIVRQLRNNCWYDERQPEKEFKISDLLPETFCNSLNEIYENQRIAIASREAIRNWFELIHRNHLYCTICWFYHGTDRAVVQQILNDLSPFYNGRKIIVRNPANAKRSFVGNKDVFLREIANFEKLGRSSIRDLVKYYRDHEIEYLYKDELQCRKQKPSHSNIAHRKRMDTFEKSGVSV